MAAAPLIRGRPLGPISLHRRRSHRDYSDAEVQLFEWFTRHVAGAIEFRELKGLLHAPEPAAVIVIGPSGGVASVSDPAREIIARMPERLVVPSPQQSAVTWVSDTAAYAATSYTVPTNSLLAVPAARDVRMIGGPEVARKLDLERLPPGRAVVVVLEPRPEVRPAGIELLERCHLTLREMEIAHLILQGRTNETIARRLGITLATVKEHVTAIYRKVGARSRAQFFALVFGRVRA